MRFMEIALADVLPSETNPREDFGDLEALAASFDYGPYQGEPVQPITVVADGSRYRVYDGERRYRAMLQRGTATCHANVCEDLDEADMLVMAMVTDDKKKLTDAEKDHGVQRMLLLGVDPVAVDRAARVEGAASAKRGYALVEDALALTFEQAKALDEFEGDDEAVSALAELAGKKAFDRKLAELRNRKTVLGLRAALSAALDGLKVRRVDKCPYGSKVCCSTGEPDEVAAKYMEASAGHTGIVAEFKEGEWNEWWSDKPRVVYYGVPMADGDDADEVARRNAELEEKADRLLQAWPTRTDAHDVWFADLLPKLSARDGRTRSAAVKANRGLAETVAEAWQDIVSRKLDEFGEATGYWIGQGSGGVFADMGPADWIRGWQLAKPDEIQTYTIRRIVDGTGDEWVGRYATELLDWLDVLEASGYGPSPDERELYAACEAFVKEGKDADD